MNKELWTEPQGIPTFEVQNLKRKRQSVREKSKRVGYHGMKQIGCFWKEEVEQGFLLLSHILHTHQNPNQNPNPNLSTSLSHDHVSASFQPMVQVGYFNQG